MTGVKLIQYTPRERMIAVWVGSRKVAYVTNLSDKQLDKIEKALSRLSLKNWTISLGLAGSIFMDKAK